MKRIILSIILTLIAVWVKAHDIDLATFHLTPNNGVIEVEIAIDREDLKNAILQKETFDWEDIAIRNCAIEKYLSRHLRYNLNGESFQTIFTKIESDHLTFHINGILSNFCDEVEKLEVENSCLVDIVEDHSNVIFAHFYARTRGFRLSDSRRVAIIDYRDD